MGLSGSVGQRERVLYRSSERRPPVDSERTELEWTYEPADFFEAQYRHSNTEYEFLIEDGRAIATLRDAQDPISHELQQRIAIRLNDIFAIRQFQTHRKYVLRGPRVYQYAAGRRNVVVQVGAADLLIVGMQADFVVQDSVGNVVRDTRAERIAEDTAVLDSLVPKIDQSDTLRSLIASYSRSVNDPSDELVHLYEIRDALSKHYGGEEKARATLGITKSEWRRIGALANVEPLEQGRHRGKHPTGRRVATAVELEEAQEIVLRWILRFAALI